MTTGIPDVSDDVRSTVRSRDADSTRQLLLDAARRRFALDGYSATTVRDIAGEAGVNVALINRYFASKEGLFEACLSNVAVQLDQVDDEITLDRIVRRVVEQIVAAPNGEKPLQLLLLLRSSGDERADLIRRNTLRGFSERVAAAFGWTPGRPGSDELLVRAQIAICTGLGIALVRSSASLEPLTSASAHDLIGPLTDSFSALLSDFD